MAGKVLLCDPQVFPELPLVFWYGPPLVGGGASKAEGATRAAGATGAVGGYGGGNACSSSHIFSFFFSACLVSEASYTLKTFTPWGQISSVHQEAYSLSSGLRGSFAFTSMFKA